MADFILTPTVQGAGTVQVVPGQAFTVDFVLSGSRQDACNSAIFRMILTVPGVEFWSAHWTLPFVADSIFDDSKPRGGQLPIAITHLTLAGPGYQDGVVDAEMSNVAESGVFSGGIIASIQLKVPANWSGDNQIVLAAIPDTFANGFDVVNASPGNALVISVVPGVPTPLLCVAFAMTIRRRKR